MKGITIYFIYYALENFNKQNGLSSIESNDLGIPKLSIKNFKNIIGDESLDDNQAQQVVDSLYELSAIAYRINNNI